MRTLWWLVAAPIAGFILGGFLFGCSTTSTACLTICRPTCREADEAYQNDFDKNAMCAECLRECARSR